MTPYYSHAGITIYHGDCREVLPLIGGFCLLVTDPPYPKLKGNMVSRMEGGVSKRRTDQETVGLPWGDDITPLRTAFDLSACGALIFCSFHSVSMVPGVVGADPLALVTWYKRNSMPPVRNVPHYQTEFVWAFNKGGDIDWRKLKTHYDIPLLQGGCMAVERIQNEDGSTAHPTQKPLRLMGEILKIGGQAIVDPYMGTGTTLLACKNAGKQCTGIDIEERWCEIAARRLEQEVFAL